jgi:hypothetical protein
MSNNIKKDIRWQAYPASASCGLLGGGLFGTINHLLKVVKNPLFESLRIIMGARNMFKQLTSNSFFIFLILFLVTVIGAGSLKATSLATRNEALNFFAPQVNFSVRGHPKIARDLNLNSGNQVNNLIPKIIPSVYGIAFAGEIVGQKSDKDSDNPGDKTAKHCVGSWINTTSAQMCIFGLTMSATMVIGILFIGEGMWDYHWWLWLWQYILTPNDPDHRRRAGDAPTETARSSRRSVHPAC